MKKSHICLIIGMAFLLLAFPSLYMGLCLGVMLKSLAVLPLPCMFCIVLASIAFYMAEQYTADFD